MNSCRQRIFSRDTGYKLEVNVDDSHAHTGTYTRQEQTPKESLYTLPLSLSSPRTLSMVDDDDDVVDDMMMMMMLLLMVLLLPTGQISEQSSLPVESAARE